MQLDQAVERYNLANIQLDRLEGELRKNTRLIGVARGSLRNANEHLSRRLVSLYVNGGEPSALEVVLGAEVWPTSWPLDTIDRVGSQDARVVGDVKRFRAEVISARSVSSALAPTSGRSSRHAPREASHRGPAREPAEHAQLDRGEIASNT